MGWHCPKCKEPHPVRYDEPTDCRACEVAKELGAEIERLRGELACTESQLTSAGSSRRHFYRQADDAAEELDEARARIAELEAAQRWIPVSERLPEDGQHVVAIVRSDTLHDAEIDVVTWCHPICEEPRLVHGDVLRATHWRPLPPLPEEE